MQISVMLVDDHAVVRDGLQALLDAQPDTHVVGSFGNAADALRYAAEASPDVAVLDITLPDTDGIEVARRIRDLCPETHILMLSMHASAEHVYQALRNGATGYVLKESAGREVVAAVRAVHLGRRYLSGKISPAALEDYARERGADEPLDRLSPREREVLELVVNGRTSNEIAARLGLSPKSIDTYRSRVMLKLGVEDLPSLVKFAIRHGLTSL
jgi:DNA-binding NarL/FixJ family response regulator